MRKTFDGTFVDRNGVDIVNSLSMPMKSFIVAYRSILNPVDYNGRYIQEIKDSYKTNELGFAIFALFFVALS